jgi:hypothetical protein
LRALAATAREKQMKKPSKSPVSANKSNCEIKSMEPKHFGRGRPTKYKPEYVQIAKQLAKLGAIDADLADAFQVRISTIRLWMNIHPEFSEAIKAGKQAANKRVERSLYERANGYNYPAVKIFMPAGSKQPIVVHYGEHCPPDVGAAFIWLKNRDPDRWRDVQNVEHVLGKYIISDKPMSEEEWARERATVIDETATELPPNVTPALPQGNSKSRK